MQQKMRIHLCSVLTVLGFCSVKIKMTHAAVTSTLPMTNSTAYRATSAGLTVAPPTNMTTGKTSTANAVVSGTVQRTTAYGQTKSMAVNGMMASPSPMNASIAPTLPPWLAGDVSALGNLSGDNSSNPFPSLFSCFPRRALVEMELGVLKRMDELEVGDRVKVAHGRYAEVFMFTHQTSEAVVEFVLIGTESGHAIQLTPGHYLYLNGALKASERAQIGDEVMLGDGSMTRVVSLSRKLDTGLFNPQTVHGDIVVDGVVTSTYTTAVSPAFAHAWLAPLRSLYSLLGISSASFRNGAGRIVRFLPHGASS